MTTNLSTNHNIYDKLQADSWAGWSFVGIIIPIVGWIMGGMSLSKLKYYSAQDSAEQIQVNNIRSEATWGIILSTISFVIMVSLPIYSNYKETQLEKLKANSNTYPTYVPAPVSQTDYSEPQDYNSVYRSNFINACIANGGNSYYCQCALNLLEARYSYKEALSFESRGYFPPALLDAISTICI